MRANARNGLIAAFFVVLGWVIVFIFLFHAWSVLVQREAVVDAVGMTGSEWLRTAPRFGYFFLAGLVLGHIFGTTAGAKWAFVSAVLSMGIDVLLERMSFPDGIDAFALVLLAINYALPPVMAVAGALVNRLWTRSAERTIAT